jgi:hypothetical protein
MSYYGWNGSDNLNAVIGVIRGIRRIEVCRY